MSMVSSRPGRLLVILAHPDDESFGTAGVVSRATAAGAQVTLVSATRGEAGEIANPALATPATLGTVREGELRAAARAMGVDDVRFLGYRDSGMAGSPDNAHPHALIQAPEDEVVERIVRIIRDIRPDTVVTFDPAGVYGHPDHVAMNKYVTRAFDLAGNAEVFPEAGPPYQPERLYYIAEPRSRIREMVNDLRAANLDLGPFRDVDVDRMGVPDEQVTASIDVRPWLAQKIQALASHRTQIGPNDWFTRLPESIRNHFLGRENFVQARGAITTQSRRDLLPDPA